MPNKTEFTKRRQVKALALRLARRSLEYTIRLSGKRVCDFSKKDINSKAKEAAPLFEELAQEALDWFYERYDID